MRIYNFFFAIITAIFLIAPNQLPAQVDNIRHIDSIIYEMERPYRSVMDTRDSILVKQILGKIDSFKTNIPTLFLDSLMVIITDGRTPLALAQPLADIIASTNGEKSILLLLNNINCHKAGNSITEVESPCFAALRKSSRQTEVCKIILDSDYLDTFRPVRGALYSSDQYLVSLFRGFPNADASIREVVKKTRSTKKVEMLNFILTQLK